MSQTRNTIDLLTAILKENGTSKVKSETIRLAKFNHEDAVAPLWRLLFELVYQCEFGKIDSVCVRACTQLSTEELVVYVKREMQLRGFYSKEFAMLPNNMSGGSREILLALGWIMCKENIISRFIQSCTSPIDQDTTQLFVEAPVACSKIDQSEDSTKQDMYSRVQQLLLLNNKLRLSLRSLYAQQRNNSLLRHKIHEATYGIMGADGDSHHLSEMEVHMLRHPQLLKSNLELLAQDNERLQNLLSWRDHEDHFWKWMGSVLDAKIQSRSLTSTNQPINTNRDSTVMANTGTQQGLANGLRMVSSAINGLPVSSGVDSFAAVYSRPGGSNEVTQGCEVTQGHDAYRGHEVTQGREVTQGHEVTQGQDVTSRLQLDGGMYSRLERSHLTLNEAIIKYESIVQHLEHVWEQKSSEITDSELDSVLSSIEQELAFQSTNAMLQNCHAYLQNDSPGDSTSLASDRPSVSNPRPEDPRFRYERKTQNKPLNTRHRIDETSSVASSTHSMATRDQHIESITAEINSLNHLVGRLQQEVDEKQSRFKHKMETLSGKFKDAICIPPMSAHK